MEEDKEFNTVQRASEGDPEAFRELVERYGDRIFSLLTGITGNRLDAEELTSDVFLKAFTHLDRFRGECRFSTWLYRLTQNVCIDFLRKQKRQQHVSLTFSEDEDEGKELSVPDPEPLPEERVIFNEKQEAIRNAMNALPVDFREILELRVVRQLPYEQIAQIMDLPVGTVKSRLARARLQLKKRLDAGNFFETGASKRSE